MLFKFYGPKGKFSDRERGGPSQRYLDQALFYIGIYEKVARVKEWKKKHKVKLHGYDKVKKLHKDKKVKKTKVR